MSSNLIPTEPGGEQTQYEGIHTHVDPPSKQPGQMGDPATSTASPPAHAHKAASNAPNTQSVTPAEKMRYGQSIQEGGMGGKTDAATGEAGEEGGFGGTEALEQGGDAAQERREQGYGGERDMDRSIGA
ncbi:hypothetical protein BU26DRAFT_599926 [Trematosphaeria pertusa]|uniref:Uncharacterized protein n=1 Tax=Trematosphaeria pertusa TaxID=390896 RepID=A0A6A6J7K0_9PLEO|nr:uncharacterized protein BU26DRAFT_599926 [Trematosphaeria pertusa]KAF2257423.1 hypothetical protein BU26DRAFT_599926 [Trematosphaeria pertusa]